LELWIQNTPWGIAILVGDCKNWSERCPEYRYLTS
jgi:hypothetical protein